MCLCDRFHFCMRIDDELDDQVVVGCGYCDVVVAGFVVGGCVVDW